MQISADPRYVATGRVSAKELGLFIGLPLLGLLLLTAIFHFCQLDQRISRLFYDDAAARWSHCESQPWMALYHYGPLPALVLGIGGAVLGVAGCFWKTLHPWRQMGFFLAILLALGPGLAINGVLKPQLCRPRPNQVKDFGGDHEFVSVWNFGPRDASKSFPCGHASMGFFFMGPAFLLYRRRPRWALSFLLLGLLGGGILGLARVVQGQHFTSDVLWSGGLVYLSGAVLSYGFFWSSGVPLHSGGSSSRPIILSMEDKDSSETSSETADRRRAA